MYLKLKVDCGCWHRFMLAVVMALSSMAGAFMPTAVPLAIAQTSVIDAIANGTFEGEFIHQDGCGKVAEEWGCFTNGGRINYSYRNDTRASLVLEGRASQRIQIHTMGMTEADDDRFGGIYQTISVAPNASYSLNLYGMIHTNRLEGDPWRYNVQVGWNEGQDTDWRNVTNWRTTNWRTFYERNMTGEYSNFATTLSSQSSSVTLFIRLENKWGHTSHIVDLNLDAISLVGPPPALITVCDSGNQILNGSFDQGFVNIESGTVGQYWGAFTTSQDGANYSYQSESRPDLRSDTNYGQAISIDSIGIAQPRRDRLAGIYYRLSGLTPGQLYELTVHGQLRATENVASSEHFSAQWGYAVGSNPDPRSVQDWFWLDLGPVRPDNIMGQMTEYVTRFPAESSEIVLFLSGWKQSRVADVTVTMNLDEISLRACTTRRR